MLSAYKCTDRPCFKTIDFISLVHKIYKRGPSNEPWGTPKCSLLDLLNFLLIHMLKVLLKMLKPLQNFVNSSPFGLSLQSGLATAYHLSPNRPVFNVCLFRINFLHAFFHYIYKSSFWSPSFPLFW